MAFWSVGLKHTHSVGLLSPRTARLAPGPHTLRLLWLRDGAARFVKLCVNGR